MIRVLIFSTFAVLASAQISFPGGQGGARPPTTPGSGFPFPGSNGGQKLPSTPGSGFPFPGSNGGQQTPLPWHSHPLIPAGGNSTSGGLGGLPLVGGLLGNLGGILGQILNDVGVVVNEVLQIVQQGLQAVDVLVNGLLSGLLNDSMVQQIISTLPAPVQNLVRNLVQAVEKVLNDLQGAVPPVQQAVKALLALITSPLFGNLSPTDQLTGILGVIGNLTQQEVTVVQQILSDLAGALNGTGSLPPVSGLPISSVTPSLSGVGSVTPILPSLPTGSGIPSITPIPAIPSPTPGLGGNGFPTGI